MSRLEKVLFSANLTLWAIFAIFSYAYVDLNLTISQNPLVLDFVAFMQQLGYFKRPQATLIYLFLIILAFSLFIFNLLLFYKSKIGLSYLKLSTIANTLVLILAYPFLSSDLFNYLFDAKIILNYHSNPYTHRPLDFPNDEWLRFMRWIHRYSPYGPLWLGMSLIPAAAGLGKFILNFFAFKIFIGIFHLINSLLIYKTLLKVNPELAMLGTAFYSLNPLFLIEGVANAHNDVVVATFFLASIYYLANAKKLPTLAAIFAGVFIKYIQILTLPWYIAYSHLRKITFEQLIILNLATMAIFTYLYSSFKITVPFVSSGATQVQFQSWYLFWTIPFVALLPKFPLIVASIAISVGASLRYLPYLYYGHWSAPGTTSFMQTVTFIPLIFAALFLIGQKFKQKK